MPRSSIAAATAPALLGGIGDQHADLLRRRCPPATRCSTARATACACARSLAQRQKLQLRDRGSARSSRTRSPARVRPRRTSASAGVASVGRSISRRETWFGLSAASDSEHRQLGRRRLLQLVDHQLAEALGDPPPHVGALDQQAVEGEEDVAAVEAAGLGEDAVVGGVELGELELAPDRLAARPRRGRRLLLPGARSESVVGPTAFGLQPRRSAPAAAPAARPGCRGSRGGAAAGWSSRSSSIASRSARPSTSKKGSRPASSECSRRRRSPIVSQLPIQSSSKEPSSSASQRSRRRAAVAWRGGDHQHALGPGRRRRRGAPGAGRAARSCRCPAAPTISSGPALVRDRALALGEPAVSVVGAVLAHHPKLAAARSMRPMDVLSADWPAICRRIVAAQRPIFERARTQRGAHRLRGRRRGRRPHPGDRPRMRGRRLRRARRSSPPKAPPSSPSPRSAAKSASAPAARRGS